MHQNIFIIVRATDNLKTSPPVKSVSPHEIEGILGAVLLYIILNSNL